MSGFPNFRRARRGPIHALLWLALVSMRAGAEPPAIGFQSVAMVSPDTAVLSGRVTANGVNTTAWFEWGPGTNLEARTTVTSVGDSGFSVTVRGVISNLLVGQSYSYRLVATNGLGATAAGVQTLNVSFVPGSWGSGLVLPGVQQGSVAWADFNGDGAPGVLLAGLTTSSLSSAISRAYRNNGFGGFSVYYPFPGLVNGLLAWGDFDNNGAVDLFMNGSPDMGTFAALYRNDGFGFFTEVNATWPLLSYGSAAWGDYDNDGDLDLLLGGRTGSADFYPRVCRVYENQRGVFVWNTNAVLPGLQYGVASWGDYDRDGDLDILLSAAPDGAAQVFENRGDNTFRRLSTGPLDGGHGVAAWVDYDGDGDLDLVTGAMDPDSGLHTTRIYRNDDGHFVWDTSVKLLDVAPWSVHWADYDNDGAVDLFIAGERRHFNSVEGRLSRLYLNRGGGQFVEVDCGLDALSTEAAAPGDVEGDGKLDLLIVGAGDSSESVTRLYRNALAPPNTVPAPPSNLVASVRGRGVTLNWSHGSDRQTTNVNWLSYNLRVGLTPGGSEIISPQASSSTGWRLLFAPGNAPQRNAAFLTNLVGLTTYYWSVQTIDTCFSGSRFAPERSFAVPAVTPGVQTLPAADITGDGATVHGTVNPEKMPSASWFEYGPTTAYGSVTPAHSEGSGSNARPTSAVLTGLVAGVTYHYRLVATNSVGRSEGGEQAFAVPTFSQVPASFAAVLDGTAAWGDYDADGDLDLILSGEVNTFTTPTRLYRNEGNGVFAELDIGLPNLILTSLAWGDYDNDGDLDLFVASGTWAGTVSRIYRNDGTNSFHDIEAGLAGFVLGSAAWVDFDNDGDLDLSLVGNDLARIYRNDGHDNFVDIQAEIPQPRLWDAAGRLLPRSMAWGDYDGDGDLDLALSGTNEASSGSIVIELYRNDGNGSFSRAGDDLAGTIPVVMAWGDYDNDGELDLLVGAESGSRVYRNEEGHRLVELNTPFPGTQNGTAAWGDYNNDGLSDVLFLGLPSLISDPATAVYENRGGGTFVDSEAPLPARTSGTGAWGDYDNDGDLDLFLCGAARLPTGLNPFFSSLHRNNRTAVNTPPSAPGQLASTVRGAGVTLTWGPASAGPNVAGGLSYNLRVGTKPGGIDVVAPQADGQTGFRRLPQPGNVPHGRTALLTNLASEITYYWSVQAMDAAYVGSRFSEEGSFTIFSSPPWANTLPALGVAAPVTQLNGEVNPLGLPTTAWFEWGTSTNYSNQGAVTNLGGRSVISLRLAMGRLVTGTTYHFRIVATNSAGRVEGLDRSFELPLFTDLGGDFRGISQGSAAWGDFDNDGRLDILLAGIIDDNRNSTAAIYHNNADGTFSELDAKLPRATEASVAWGDLDRDGLLDFVIAGRVSGFYHNLGGGVFTNTGPTLPALSNAGVGFGDADNDGALDALITGGTEFQGRIALFLHNEGAGVLVTNILHFPNSGRAPVQWGDFDLDGDLDLAATARIFENTGAGSFAEVPSGSPDSIFGAMAWGDYDHDGDLDCLGEGTDLGPFSEGVYRVYRNDGHGRFVALPLELPLLASTAVAWGDYDNDGDLDFVLAGRMTQPWSSITRVYRNDGNDTFVPMEANLPGVSAGSLAWGDADQDGDLDLLVTGATPAGRYTHLYRNNSAASNHPPSSASGLVSTVTGPGVRLSWNPASDLETTDARGLSYGLRVGTAPGGSDVVSPAADLSSGLRRLPQFGPVPAGAAAWLTNLPPGRRYYWTVQAIDPGLAGSPFAAEQEFATQPVRPTVTTLPPGPVAAPQTQLNGQVDPGGAVTAAWFEWGASTNYGNVTPVARLDDETRPLPLSILVTNLTALITYHFRLVATNEAGVSLGTDQTFTPPWFVAVPSGLPAVSRATAGWGDFNNDGNLDIVLSGLLGGQRVFRVYRGDGRGTFRFLAAGSGVQDGAVASGDLDNDGDLDLLVTGAIDSTLTGICRFHRNDGKGGLLEFDLGVPGVLRSAATWADFDRDGILEFCLAGAVGTQPITRIYRREQQQAFRQWGSALPGVDDGTLVSGDFDNDGLVDVLLTGSTNGLDTGVLSRLYRNQGGGVFSNLNLNLPGLWRSAAAAADYDNDGDLDFILAGWTGLQRLTRLYRNEGNNTFSELAAGLPGVESGSLAWGDVDNDGRVDLVLTGSTNGLPAGVISCIYHNAGAGVFTLASASLPGIWRGAATLGDFDNDHDLDLLLAGDGVSNTVVTVVHRNDYPIPNQPPEAPAGLRARTLDRGVVLSWDPPTDPQTPSSALTFNLRVGTTPGGAQLFSAQASSASGFRRVSEPGNVQQSRVVALTNLPSDSLCYWSVQAVDATWSGSPFAEEQMAYVGAPKILQIVLDERAGPRLTLAGPSETSCLIQVSTNLLDWFDQGSALLGPAGLGTFSEGVAAPLMAVPRFYRLRGP